MIRTLIIAALCVGLALPASAKSADVAANVAILQNSSSTKQLIDACKNLMSALVVTIPRSSAAQSSTNGDAAFGAMKAFVLTGHDTPARVRCARYLGNLSLLGIEPPDLKTVSPYA